ncbi:MAG: hypothetical protein ACR2IJ_11135 [Fluviibacter sp.]
MKIKGAISRKLLGTVQKNMGLVSGDPIPAGLIVLIDSKGGDGGAAMKIGRLLRQANAHVFVTGDCASACVFVLAGGVVRGASAYSVGVHSGRVTVSDDNAKVLREVDLDKEPGARQAFANFKKEARAYFSEMGVQPELYETMEAHALRGVHRLNDQELRRMGLVGFDAHYLNTRSAFYEAQSVAYRMDKAELYDRTLRVASVCIGESDQNAFIACYKKTLMDPY